MDLLATLATELNIPIVSPDQKIWFFRTKSGKYYPDYRYNNYIALGWNRIPPDLINDTKVSAEVKKERIERLYPEEKRPGLILGQMEVFLRKMSLGDLVVIPSTGGRAISIGIIGELCDSVQRDCFNGDYPVCEYRHKRKVTWIKTIEASQDIYLFKALRAQQTISDITDEAPLIRRNLDPAYISGETLHLTLQKRTNENLGLANNVNLLVNLLSIINAATDLYGKERFDDNVYMKTAVGSLGFLEIIFPNSPTAVISAGVLILLLIGVDKAEDGSITLGIASLFSEINKLVNDYSNRKKVHAETDLISTQAEKTRAEIELVHAQTAKTHAETAILNAEARKRELLNQQIELTGSGKTTEEIRLENEELSIPNKDQIEEATNVIVKSAVGLLTAAEVSGISYDGKSVKKF